MAMKLAVNKPNKTSAGIIRYKFEVKMLVNKITAPVIDKYPPTTFSPSIFIKLLASNRATISPALKKTITRPPKKRGANKSLVNHKDDQSIIIPIVAKLNINKIPKINMFFFGN